MGAWQYLGILPGPCWIIVEQSELRRWLYEALVLVQGDWLWETLALRSSSAKLALENLALTLRDPPCDDMEIYTLLKIDRPAVAYSAYSIPMVQQRIQMLSGKGY